MNTFTKYWQQIKWDSICSQIDNQTSTDVECALATENLGLTQMMALLSPVALSYIEPIAQRAQQLTRNRFGNTVNLYLPLYLSNFCINDCTYCGYSVNNRIQRKVLDANEIINECRSIREQGIDSILLVTGEHKGKAGFNYFYQHLPLVRQAFSMLMMEVQPLSQTEYTKLKNLGLDGVLVYQETYNLAAYRRNHLRGPKQDFIWRLETPDRIAKSGIDKIGLGVLMGLSNNWRADSYIMAQHLMYMRSNYWKNQYSLSFPRLRPCIGGVTPSSIITEAQLLQVMCAFRLLAPEVEISLSTRESANFRDHVIPIVANNVSAGSKTHPGGYANSNPQLEQFLPKDNRSLQNVATTISSNGLYPIWKDWNSSYNCIKDT